MKLEAKLLQDFVGNIKGFVGINNREVAAFIKDDIELFAAGHLPNGCRNLGLNGGNEFFAFYKKLTVRSKIPHLSGLGAVEGRTDGLLSFCNHSGGEQHSFCLELAAHCLGIVKKGLHLAHPLTVEALYLRLGLKIHRVLFEQCLGIHIANALPSDAENRKHKSKEKCLAHA